MSAPLCALVVIEAAALGLNASGRETSSMALHDAHAAVKELAETQRVTLRMLEAAHRGMGMWTGDNPRIVRARAALERVQGESA